MTYEDDEPYDPYLHIDTYKDFYSRSMFLVNYGKSVKGRVKKDKPTRYCGYASKVSIAAFEIDEYDTIGYWLTPEEYKKNCPIRRNRSIPTTSGTNTRTGTGFIT